MADLNVVGVFPNDDAAKAALRRMDEAGFPADRVSIVASNVRQAREVAGSRSYTAAIIGAVIGAGIGLVLALATTMSVNNAAAIPVGMLMFAVAGGFIGMLAGRGKALKADKYERYHDKIDQGDALVTIRCEQGRQEQARETLRAAGATSVRIEGTPETV